MNQVFLLLAALNGFIVVALGAFGAHALETRVLPELLDVYQTGVQYQMFHTVALLAVHILLQAKGELPGLRLSGFVFLFGIILFSGSLYLLALSGLTWLGIITPLGGLAFLAGWLLLARAAMIAGRQ